MRTAVKAAATGAIMAVLTQACAGGVIPTASSGAAASGAPTYGIYGTDRYFNLDWQPDQRGGRPIVSGYVTNQWGLAMRNVRLRVESLDAAGNATGSYLGYVNGYLPPGTRVYFEVPVPAASPSYRVSVLSFDVIQGHGGG